MSNPLGRNGHENGTPPDNLSAILTQFSIDGIPLEGRLQQLAAKHNYVIGRTKLIALNKKYKVTSARKPPAEHIATSLIAKQMSENVTGTNGPNTIQKRVAIVDGIVLSRRVVRSTMRALDPHGAERRFPSKQPTKKRSTLTDVGVYYELHFDGHEKLNFKALQMGRAGIDMYGGRCHGSGSVLLLDVVPNARCGITVGHLYLDLVEETGEIPIQVTVDGGTETHYMFQLHQQLRAQFAPELSIDEAPATVALKSSDNIPIEALWSYLLKFIGHDLKAVILLGKEKNYLNITNDIHIDLFHWLWSRIVKQATDQFKIYWNTHKTRRQSAKHLPSGVSPRQVFDNPQNYGLYHAGIKVDIHAVRELRNTLPKSRVDCFRWVSDEFDVQAQLAYNLLGSPKLSISGGWTIYTNMLSLLM
ncbi:hypothetical protein MIND_01274300 [Mycena indigotica]|uniref:Integrase core domain-containing protein n=1 Tax=Mycena indigotica TaxID=2126181 RepID=A0A8H6VV67_9AGAR|nr:uncharacterized protein MIND_01274300 [Mycena indigotica]KAF7291303.1 hypothetical protein MIND_01274300 [Mycena indigotica]